MTNPLADDTNEIIGKGYIFHLNSINYSIELNGSESGSKVDKRKEKTTK